jgi:flagellar FliL protein
MAARPDSKASEGKDKPAKRGKGLWIGAVVCILVAGCVAAGWYYTRPAAHGLSDEAHSTQKQAEVIFVNLEPFTVNLADEGGERLAQVALVLELENKDMQAALSKNLPIVRNSILLLLSSQHTKTLLTLDGKLALADEIAVRTGTALGWRPAQEAEDADDDKSTQARKVSNGKPRQRTRPSAPPNPVVAVHFSQLLVQ